jgi:hypothetical protein
MKRLISHVFSVVAAATIGLLSACTQMPTEKRGVADIRPQISFQLEKAELAQAQIRINGLAMGQAGDFRDGQSSLRLISGTHHLQVLWGSQIVLDQRFYVADGVNKSFILK